MNSWSGHYSTPWLFDISSGVSISKLVILQDIRSLTHGEIVNLIKQSGLSVKLTIAEAAASPQTPHSVRRFAV